MPDLYQVAVDTLLHDGEEFPKGATLELPEKAARGLLSAGAVQPVPREDAPEDAPEENGDSDKKKK